MFLEHVTKQVAYSFVSHSSCAKHDINRSSLASYQSTYMNVKAIFETLCLLVQTVQTQVRP